MNKNETKMDHEVDIKQGSVSLQEEPAAMQQEASEAQEKTAAIQPELTTMQYGSSTVQQPSMATESTHARMQEQFAHEQKAEQSESVQADVNKQKDYRNYKEELYDRINISVKSLDIIIGILIAILVIMLLYFIIRKYT